MAGPQINIDWIKADTEEYVTETLSSMFFKVLEGQADYIISKVIVDVFTEFSKRYVLITIPIKYIRDSELIKLGFYGHKKGQKHTFYYKLSFKENALDENLLFWLFLTNFKKDYPNEFDLEVKVINDKEIYHVSLEELEREMKSFKNKNKQCNGVENIINRLDDSLEDLEEESKKNNFLISLLQKFFKGKQNGKS